VKRAPLAFQADWLAAYLLGQKTVSEYGPAGELSRADSDAIEWFQGVKGWDFEMPREGLGFASILVVAYWALMERGYRNRPAPPYRWTPLLRSEQGRRQLPCLGMVEAAKWFLAQEIWSEAKEKGDELCDWPPFQEPPTTWLGGQGKSAGQAGKHREVKGQLKRSVDRVKEWLELRPDYFELATPRGAFKQYSYWLFQRQVIGQSSEEIASRASVGRKRVEASDVRHGVREAGRLLAGDFYEAWKRPDQGGRPKGKNNSLAGPNSGSGVRRRQSR
jgi:hypothetical protein